MSIPTTTPAPRRRLLLAGIVTALAACAQGDADHKTAAGKTTAAETTGNGGAQTPDTLAPDTTLVGMPPALTNKSDIILVFSGRDNGGAVHFECRLDAAAWSSCVSPKPYTALAEAAHRFEVRAVDEAGNVDLTPAAADWRVDRTPPQTQIMAAPPASTSATEATLVLSATDDVAAAGFECNRNGAGWSPCGATVYYANLTTGVQSVAVRAKDAAGNVDPSPAAATWAVLHPSVTLSPAACTGGAVPQLDLSGPDLNWTWNDPHVLKTGAEYWMYASATDFFTFPVRSYRLVSSDGATWSRNPTEPVLADAPDGAWDAGGIETPAVVFFAGQYHLFYTGYRYRIDDPRHSVFDFRIGHAVSNDGVTFARPTTGPLFAASGTADADPGNDWYAFIVGEPGPVVFNNELYLYFTALGVDAGLGASLQVIGVIRSADGVNWSAAELALKPDQALYPRNQDWIGYSTPNAAVINERVHLFVDVANQPAGGNWRQLRLQHASSNDGLTDWRQDPSPLRSAGDFPWAIDEINSPAALLDGTLLRLYFAGHELDWIAPDYFGVGMMACDLAK